MSKLFRPAAALLALSAAALVSAALPTEAHADFARVPSPTPVDASLNGVAAVSAANVWAVGTRTGVGTLALHWDGSRWRIAATPLSATPFAGLEDVAATSTTDVWAVGESDGDSALILHNDGRGWRSVAVPATPAGTASLQGVDALAPDDAWAVGSVFDVSSASTTTLVERWNGRRWAVVPSPDPSDDPEGLVRNELTAVDARAANDVWAVGHYFDNASGEDRPLVLHWDGTRWTVVDAPGASLLTGVAARTVSDAWAVGSDGTQAGVALHWDGDTWTAVPTLTLPGCPTEADLNDVAFLSSTSVLAVGTCAAQDPQAGGRSGRTLVESWDGKSWTRVRSESPAERGDNELRALARVPAGTRFWTVGEAGQSAYGDPAQTLTETQP